MKLFLTDQKANFKKHLEFLKTKPVMTYDKSNLKEQITIAEIDTKIPFENLDLSFLFDYQIFPDNILTYLSEWGNENRKMKPGDTIVQQVHLPPIKSFSQKIIFGVKIREIIDEPNRKGYSYETLEGHVEKGISTFTIEQEENKIIFKIHSFSTPGNFLTKLLGPCLSVPYQSYCTAKAIDNVKRQIN